MADKSIRAQSQAVAAMSGDWEMIDALMDGTAAMRAAGKLYLPQWPKETEDHYQTRLKSAVLHPVFKRTVLVNASRPFSKPLQLGENIASNLEEWTEDIDSQGTPIAAFALQLFTCCLSTGLVGVLVDYPKANEIRTVADEKAAKVRPYWVKYPAHSILGWKTKKSALTQLRLLEFVEEPDGAYASKTVEQVRVLEPGKWSTWRENPKQKDEWLEYESGTTTIDFVPFVPFYGIRKGFGIGLSPLSDLAYQNVEHYQSASDQQTILHVARVPILFAKLFSEDAGDSLAVGSGGVAQAGDKDAELSYVEHNGAAIESGKDSIDALEDRMRATGAELISLQPALTTATQVSSDREATKSLLQQICENFEESAQRALEYMAAWVKEQSTSEFVLYKDFEIASASDTATLASASNAGAVSKQTLFEELQRRDVLSNERTWEDESTRLAADAAAQAKLENANE